MKLYKYLSPERIDVLIHRRIRYTQPGSFNDPFEAKPYINAIADDDTAERTVDQILPEEIKKAYEQLPAQARAVIPYEVMFSLAMQSRESLRGQIGLMLSQFTPMLRPFMNEKFNELLGILSLTEKPDNLLMWSHYAANHEGFVVSFDSTHEYFDQRKSINDEFRHLRKVEYRAARPNAPLSEMEGTDVFLVKSKEWEYEQEWRIMRPLVDAAETLPAEPFPVCLFEFPPDAVAEIILGCRMNETYRSALRNLLYDSHDFKHVEIYKTLPHEREFKMMVERDII